MIVIYITILEYIEYVFLFVSISRLQTNTWNIWVQTWYLEYCVASIFSWTAEVGFRLYYIFIYSFTKFLFNFLLKSTFEFHVCVFIFLKHTLNVLSHVLFFQTYFHLNVL